MAKNVTVVPAQPGWKLFYLCGPDGPEVVADIEFEPIVAWRIHLSEDEPTGPYEVDPIVAAGYCGNRYILIGPNNEIIDDIGNRFDTLIGARRANDDIARADP